MTLAQRLTAVPQRPHATPGRPEAAPALFRLLAESALSRAALGACRMPIALADAAAPSCPLCYVNEAFESFFGLRAAEALGRPAAELLCAAPLGAEPLFRDSAPPVRICARRRDGSTAEAEAAVGAVRGTDGRVTHWVLSFSRCGGNEEPPGPQAPQGPR
jgi:PAS domain-containing protein